MVTRRNFLRTSSMLAAGTLLPVAAEGSILQSISPNEQINVALIGCRNMGWVNLADFLKQPNVRCVALCDVNRPCWRSGLPRWKRSTGRRLIFTVTTAVYWNGTISMW